MSYKPFITEIKDRDDLDNSIVVNIATCPFCDVEYTAKSNNTLRHLMADHITDNHRAGMLTLIRETCDVEQHLLSTLATKAITLKANKMPIDLWAEMPDVCCLSDENDV